MQKLRLIKKKMIMVFFTISGILTQIVHDILDSQRTVTDFWYVKKCLIEVVQKLKELCLRSRMNI